MSSTTILVDATGGVGFPLFDADRREVLEFVFSAENRSMLDRHNRNGAAIWLFSGVDGIADQKLLTAANASLSAPLFSKCLRFPNSRADEGQILEGAWLAPNNPSDGTSVVGVSMDASIRNRLDRMGTSAVPHLRFVDAAIRRDPIRYVRIREPGTAYFGLLTNVDLELCVYHRDAMGIVAALPQSRLEDLRGLGLAVDVLDGADPLARANFSDLYLLKDLSPIEREKLGSFKLEGMDDAVLAAFSNLDQLARFHPAAPNHGSARKLAPGRRTLASEPKPQVPFGNIVPLCPAFQRRLATLDAAFIGKALQDYQEASRWNDGRRISRHIATPGNRAAVDKAADDFKQLGPGVSIGRWTGNTSIPDSLVAIIDATAPVRYDETIVIGAHIDSVSNTSIPLVAAAPGVDDDLSGVAVVLGLARLFAETARQGCQFRRNLHFALFNAEEATMEGSQSYAAKLDSQGTKVVSMIQLDMIGCPPAGARYWEIHCDCAQPDPDLKRQCSRLAEVIQSTASFASPGIWPTIAHYPRFENALTDRSDQASFHVHGFPAVLITAKTHPRPALPSPPNQLLLNPDNYHSSSDTQADSSYIAEIGRCIGGTLWQLANMEKP